MEAWLGGALLVAARVGPALLLLPFLGILGRALLLFGAVAVLLPLGVVRPAPELAEPLRLLPLLLRELSVGAALALGAALPWLIGRGAGAWLDRVRDPEVRRGPLAALYGLLALALLFGLGGGRVAVQALARSYELAPVRTSLSVKADSVRQTGVAPQWQPEPPASPAEPVILVGRLFALALWMGLPTFLAQLGAELVLALGRRAFAITDFYPLERPGSRALRGALFPLALVLGASAAVATLARVIAAQPALLGQVLDALAR